MYVFKYLFVCLCLCLCVHVSVHMHVIACTRFARVYRYVLVHVCAFVGVSVCFVCVLLALLSFGLGFFLPHVIEDVAHHGQWPLKYTIPLSCTMCFIHEHMHHHR